MSKSRKQLFITGGLVLLLVVCIIGWFLPYGDEQRKNSSKKNVQTEGDIIISTDEIGEKVSFYPYEINGVNLEVMAVKATDGTIRTAFNTCQICYSSGRGYYEQQGTAIVCQNCGNMYTADDVEVIAGGCNPVPITSEYKEESADTIIINREFLEKYQVIFENWKTNY
ncbi:MAG: DUF2318 domain-containing protein [bacterium]|nr:DUF2318 domain-containing protein [bacterium]